MSALGNKVRQLKADCDARFDALAAEADGVVIVIDPPPPPPPEVIPGGVKVLPKPWNNEYVFTQNIGGFTANDVIAVSFTTGNKAGSASNLLKILAAQWGSEPHDRVACLCDQPGKFPDSGATLNGNPVPGLASVTGQTPTVAFSLGVDNLWGYAKLKLNTPYWFNIKNVQPTEAERPYDMSVNLQIGAL